MPNPSDGGAQTSDNDKTPVPGEKEMVFVVDDDSSLELAAALEEAADAMNGARGKESVKPHSFHDIPALTPEALTPEIVDDNELVFEDVEIVDESVPDTQPAEPLEEKVLRSRITELEDELLQTQQRMMRIAADYENFKRRSDREKDEIRRFGTEKLLLEMIPVQDNFDRALSHSQNSEDRQSLLQGVEMVKRQFEGVLRKAGCEPFESLNAPFDPQRHEAVQQIETAEHPPNTVVEEYQRGYHLKERLIRPALVVVSRLPPGSELPKVEEINDPPIAVEPSGEARPSPPPLESVAEDEGSKRE